MTLEETATILETFTDKLLSSEQRPPREQYQDYNKQRDLETSCATLGSSSSSQFLQNSPSQDLQRNSPTEHNAMSQEQQLQQQLDPLPIMNLHQDQLRGDETKDQDGNNSQQTRQQQEVQIMQQLELVADDSGGGPRYKGVATAAAASPSSSPSIPRPKKVPPIQSEISNNDSNHSILDSHGAGNSIANITSRGNLKNNSNSNNNSFVSSSNSTDHDTSLHSFGNLASSTNTRTREMLASSYRSDDSYGLDASWCSTTLSSNALGLDMDKALAMSSLEEIVNCSNRSGEQEYHGVPHYPPPQATNMLGNGSCRNDDIVDNSFRSMGEEEITIVTATASDIEGGGGEGSLEGGGTSLPRLFRTGNPKRGGAVVKPVVFVDGGGDNLDASNASRKRRVSSRKRLSQANVGGSSRSLNSVTMTGFQVLTASFQSACRAGPSGTQSPPSPEEESGTIPGVNFLPSRRDSNLSSSTVGDFEMRRSMSSTDGVNSILGEGGDEGEKGDMPREMDDTQLVSAAGGKAYLHASRSVWAMRIIVVVTFLVVSVIVTTMTFVFYRSMETDILYFEFGQLSLMLAGTTMQVLEKQSSSLIGLGKMYTGVLGAEKVPPFNHPPSVMLSSTSTCSKDVVANGTTSDTKAEWKSIWPNVTLPGYNEIAFNLLEVSETRAVAFAPLLSYSGASAWEEYAQSKALNNVKEVVSKGIRTANLDLSTTAPSYRAPAWQIAPADVMEDGIMLDFYSYELYQNSIDHVLREVKNGHDGVMSSTGLISCSDTIVPVNDMVMGTMASQSTNGSIVDTNMGHGHGRSLDMHDACGAVFIPVYDAFPSKAGNIANVSGVVAGIFSWTDILSLRSEMSHNLGLHDDHEGGNDVRVVIKTQFKHEDGSHRTSIATYNVNDDGAIFIGPDRIIEAKHEDMMKTYEFLFPRDSVVYTFEMYPTDELCVTYGISNKPVQLTVVAACFFILSTLVFFIYDYFVKYRQKVVERSAAHSTRIVHSLYPAFIRDSLFENERKQNDSNVPLSHKSSIDSRIRDEEDPAVDDKNVKHPSFRSKRLKMKVSDFVDTPTTQLRRFLNHPMPSREYDYNLSTPIIELDPIAEVFEKTTVMFADIAGFTAWCSEREPSQVFRLLETVYREFDIEANKLGVFKVETVGDCYVAVTGLPDERDDHAITIAKYAIKCLLKFNVLTKRLEANLGPGTATLGMRFGLHSGPVTAGILRGEKSRFQLFGDTMNVASRMESTGEKNMIQVSQDTADLLMAAGKEHWLTPRERPVSAKGKGSIQTYWLKPGNRRRSSTNTRRSETSIVSEEEDRSTPKYSFHHALQQSWKCIGIDDNSSRLVAKERLVRWNAAILESFLLKIVDNRNAHHRQSSFSTFSPTAEDKMLSFSEKLSENIMFPDIKYQETYRKISSTMAISSVARAELIEYVARISSMYRDVPFHNFDHASHVTMSANKLLNRVCSAFVNEEEACSINGFASVTARTFGISADPLAQFVVVFSSLVHDVDHQGVPNMQLVKEEHPLAAKFENRSVAEKRSITIAWDILMEDRYTELQSAIFVNGDEMRRFKQLLINTVLATDIADKERSAAAKIRWQKAFHPSKYSSEMDDSEKLDDASLRSLKATLVFEQIMQASDVAHTMQHWETFRKWNRRLYQELSKAHKEGRGAADPKENWYGGEIGFFDFYIIPLAKKLRECGVFGTAEREYLDYALENRRRWEEEGKEIARQMILENGA